MQTVVSVSIQQDAGGRSTVLLYYCDGKERVFSVVDMRGSRMFCQGAPTLTRGGRIQVSL